MTLRGGRAFEDDGSGYIAPLQWSDTGSPEYMAFRNMPGFGGATGRSDTEWEDYREFATNFGQDRVAPSIDGTGNHMITTRPGDGYYEQLIQAGARPDAQGNITLPSNVWQQALLGYGVGHADGMSTWGPAAVAILGSYGLAGGAVGGAEAAATGAGAGAGSAFPAGSLASVGGETLAEGTMLGGVGGGGGLGGMVPAAETGVESLAAAGSYGTTAESLAAANTSMGVGAGTAAGFAPTITAESALAEGSYNTAAQSTAAATGATAPGFWDSVFTPQNGRTAAGTAISSLIGGGIEAIGNNRTANRLEDIANRSAAMADPFASQRPFYQDQLRQLWTDPNFLQNNAGYQSGVNNVNRRNAKLGQMFSGQNAQDLTNFGMGQQMNMSNTLAPLAGATTSNPGAAATAYGNAATGAAGAQNNTLASIGYAARPFINRASDYLANQIFV